ncbi:putative secondary metabolism biosynthetic enzyme [Diatrype stigma]|uniref:Secondary metabolism biosynthetic enzyme n=1 Tax=Diatrype stigma TaxID=117547 RepID=A0AAN9U689_9PEZI
MDISGNALVIGGASGIGKACALLLAKEGASQVLIADISLAGAQDTVAESVEVAKDQSFRAHALRVDTTSEDSVRSLFKEAISILGRIDYCVNCAGYSVLVRKDSPPTLQIGVQEGTDIGSLSLAEFQRFLNVNTTGMFLVTREASIVMRSQENKPISDSAPGRGSTRGSIVNLGSASSLVASAGVLPYTASKHAALGLTKNSGKFPPIAL